MIAAVIAMTTMMNLNAAHHRYNNSNKTSVRSAAVASIKIPTFTYNVCNGKYGKKVLKTYKMRKAAEKYAEKVNGHVVVVKTYD